MGHGEASELSVLLPSSLYCTPCLTIIPSGCTGGHCTLRGPILDLCLASVSDAPLAPRTAISWFALLPLLQQRLPLASGVWLHACGPALGCSDHQFCCAVPLHPSPSAVRPIAPLSRAAPTPPPHHPRPGSDVTLQDLRTDPSADSATIGLEGRVLAHAMAACHVVSRRVMTFRQGKRDGCICTPIISFALGLAPALAQASDGLKMWVSIYNPTAHSAPH